MTKKSIATEKWTVTEFVSRSLSHLEPTDSDRRYSAHHCGFRFLSKVIEYYEQLRNLCFETHSHSEILQNEIISINFNFEGGCPRMGWSMGWGQCTHR